MTTSPVLVTVLRRETPFFDDETRSRHHFLATKPDLVTILRRETPF
ncbi:hypothetical protein [Caldibacillus thermoamylovorans]|nr:hypothetical protein [Caldibacillus thermoamylovorans]